MATNIDASYPAGDGNWPGAGALLAVIETTTGRRAESFGKPDAPIIQRRSRTRGRRNPALVGDRLDTDIDGAAALGWAFALVLTGISTAGRCRSTPFTPTYVPDDLRGLFDAP